MKIISSLITTLLCLTLSITQAQTTPVSSATVLEALDKALKHEKLAPMADKLKLYSCNCSAIPNNTSYSFTFFDGGDMLHTLSIRKDKEYYSSREKGSFSLFKDLDFSAVPAPKEVVMAGMVENAKKALTALEFAPSTDKVFISYSLRNQFKEKTKAVHYWYVTMLVGDGSSSKMIGFKDGKLSSMAESSIKR